jgi:hypothetical protein
MYSIIFVVLLICLGVVFLWITLKLYYSSVRKKLGELIQRRFAEEDIIGATTKANCFGLKSLGSFQLRGNGALILTKEQVCFLMASPEKEYVVSLKSISSVSMPKSFNGKSVFSPLLHIQFFTGDDQKVQDEIAWVIHDPREWKDSIEKLQEKIC